MTDRTADEVAIRRLVHRYADAASRRDPLGVASTFTDDGVWHSPGLGHHRGHEAILSFCTAMLDGWAVFLQGLQSGVVVFDAADPDRAAGRWFVQETGQRADGANVAISGVYHDSYLREGGEWLIESRRYDALLRGGDGGATALPYPTDVSEI